LFVPYETDVLTLLTRYARYVDLVLITNGTRRMQRAKLARTGLACVFREILVSEEAGIAKPNPALFEQALARTGTSPDRALMIGDDVTKDIDGAHHAGLKTCWVSHGRGFPADRFPPDLVITTIRELPEVLPCPST